MVPFEHLGPYRIGEPIGRGGMGTVFMAVHEKSGEQVAVKVIAASVADDMRFRSRFSTEIETLKKLKHANIVSLIGHGEQHGQLFYSMELVQGESLQHLLRREKRLQWPFVLNMAIQVCNALKHAHNFGVIHRDLKPANLLIAKDGTTKLVDFGIAKLFGNIEQTAAGSLLGTADFMAPEQATDGPITPRTDLYALGNVLYACFAGRPPFAGRTMTRVIESLRREAPAPLDLIAPELPEEIVQLVHALLQKVPDDRPPTALAVMNRMMAIRAGLQRHSQMSDVNALPSKGDASPNESVVNEKPTQIQEPGSAETPTVVAEDAIVPGTAIPRGDMTTQESVASLGAASPNTRRDQASVLTGESLKLSGARSAAQPRLESNSHALADPLTKEVPPTHFSTIEERERRRGIWESKEELSHDRWTHILSIAAMVGVLVGAAGLFLWSMRRPSADDLHRDMLLSRDRDDSLAFRSQLDQFKRLYPGDDRVVELEPYLDELDATRIVRRLRLAAVRDGGDDRLAPHEQSFLDAMRSIEQDPAKSRRMLRHWLDVYDPPGGGVPQHEVLDPELQAMARAAKQEWIRLSAQPIAAGDARASELIQRIEWAINVLPAEDLRKMLTGIISLYADKSWAEPAIQLARTRLQELELDSDR